MAQVRKENGDFVLLGALATGSASRAIEEQERNGQASLIHAREGNVVQIPLDGSEHAEAFEAIGITLGEPTDELFRSATLPEGWKIVATDHSMWTRLLDDKGEERASIFYKAAFYDRRAHISLTRPKP